ncbi:MAG: hypothetical protein ABI301_04605, partial [Jatrophihabitantaceae bacterium]
EPLDLTAAGTSAAAAASADDEVLDPVLAPVFPVVAPVFPVVVPLLLDEQPDRVTVAATTAAMHPIRMCLCARTSNLLDGNNGPYLSQIIGVVDSLDGPHIRVGAHM